MKHLLVTDTHLGLYNSNDIWHNITLNLFAEIHDVCLKNNIDSVIHLGDFFHDRKSINTKTLDMALSIAENMLKDFRVAIITGNHDTYYKNLIHPSSLQLFEGFNNIRVFYNTGTLEYDDSIILCPWNTDMGRVAGRYTADHYIMGHFDINGFHMNNSYVCEKGKYNIDVFTKFKKVISGHFHMPSERGNITYLGSPYGQSFHDINSIRGYYIFDSETDELEFFEYTNAPKFVKMNTENINLDIVKGNYVKLIYDHDYGNTKNQRLLDEVMAMEPLQLTTDFSNTGMRNDETREEDVDMGMLDHKEIIKEYVDKTEYDVHINRRTLWQFFESIMEEL